MSRALPPTRLNTWRLFITAHAKMIQHIDKRLSDAQQIPLNWYDVLIELYEAPDKRLRMSELATRVVLTRSGLTRLVDRLETEGYLKREIDPADRRGFYAIITPEGTEAMRQAWKIYELAIVEVFARHVDDATNDTLKQTFERFIDALTDAS